MSPMPWDGEADGTGTRTNTCCYDGATALHYAILPMPVATTAIAVPDVDRDPQRIIMWTLVCEGWTSHLYCRQVRYKQWNIYGCDLTVARTLMNKAVIQIRQTWHATSRPGFFFLGSSSPLIMINTCCFAPPPLLYLCSWSHLLPPISISWTLAS